MLFYKILCLIFISRICKSDDIENDSENKFHLPHFDLFHPGHHDKNRCPFFDKRVEGQSFGDQNAADAACGQRPQRCDPKDVFYRLDGSCNNINIPSWAQVGTPYVRLLPANYSDGKSKLRTSVDGGDLPSARKITLHLLTEETVSSKKTNIFYYGFGQLFDHDITLARPIDSTVECCINKQPAPFIPEDECLPITMAEDDPFFSHFKVKCIDFKRMKNTQSAGCNLSPIFQTGVMDLSVIYGTSDSEAKLLRAGAGGLLKVTKGERTSHQEYPLIGRRAECTFGGVSREKNGECFIGGDERINQNPEILTAAVIFIKFHNFVAKNLQSVNPHWDDEHLFKVARRICIAIYQHVITSEYISVLIGVKTASLYKLLPATSGYIKGYDPNLNPQTLESYAGATGRAGHSNIVGNVKYTGSSGNVDSYKLRDKFFNGSFLLEKNMFSNMLHEYIEQPCNRQDQFFTPEINNWMFHSTDESFGFDLTALDILRGRDFGLPPYNKFREACGWCKLNKFEDLRNEIRRPEDVEKLKALYKSVDDIDYYVGGLLEKPLPDGILGQSFACIQAESFFRWKFGDRLFYEFSQTKFSLAQLDSIRRTSSMSNIICVTNPWLKSIQKNSFLLESSQNPKIECADIPVINFELWKEK